MAEQGHGEKKRLIGSLSGPNFALMTAKMDHSRLISLICAFEKIFKRKLFGVKKETL